MHLPRLQGDWLVYLREGSRVLTRPKFVSGDPDPEVPQHRLGRAMAQPFLKAQEDLQYLVTEMAQNPKTAEASQTIQGVMKLVLALNGLPPKPFEIFSKSVNAGALAPLLLYSFEHQNVSNILELLDRKRVV